MYLSDRTRADGATAATTVGDRRRPVAGTVIVLGIVSLFTDISSESVSAILPIYLTSVVGLSALGYGFIDGIYQGVSALVRILGGWLADRGDRPKWIAFLGYGASAVTKVLLIPFQSFGAVTAIITVDRLGKGLRTAPRDALIAASSPPESLGRAFGVHRALDTTGAVLGPLAAFAILLAVPDDYRSVFVVSFAAALIGLAVLLLFVPDLRPRRAGRSAAPASASPDQPAPDRPAPEPPPPLPLPSFRLLADRRFGRVVVVAAALGILTIGDGFLYLALVQRDDVDTKYFPLFYVGTNLAYLMLAIPFGRIADRIGRAKVYVGGHLALLAAYLCVGGPVGGNTIAIAALLLLGTYYAATDGVLAALTSRLVDTSVRASGIATTQTVVAAARFVSSLGFGFLLVTLGRQPSFLVVAIGLVAALPLAWALIRKVERGSVSPAEALT